MKKSPLSTSRRSAIQATDSTCNGMDGEDGRHPSAGPQCCCARAAARPSRRSLVPLRAPLAGLLSRSAAARPSRRSLVPLRAPLAGLLFALGPAGATLPPLACAASGTARWRVVALGPAGATLPPLACAASGTARWRVVALGPARATLPPLACAASGTARWRVVALGPAGATLPPLACAASGTARWSVVALGPAARPSRRSLVPLRAPLAGRSSAAGPKTGAPTTSACSSTLVKWCPAGLRP